MMRGCLLASKLTGAKTIQFLFPARAIIARQSVFSTPAAAAEGYYQSERMRPCPPNGRHFHNNDSCILSASRLITLSLPRRNAHLSRWMLSLSELTPSPPLIAPSLNFTTKRRRLRREREDTPPAGQPSRNLFESPPTELQSIDIFRPLIVLDFERSN